MLDRIAKMAKRSMAAFPFGSNTTGNPDPALSKLPQPQSDLDYRAVNPPLVKARNHSRHALLIKDTTVDTGIKIKKGNKE